MDGYSGKRPGGGFAIACKGSGLSLRDASNHDDRSVNCNRLVCSNRKNFSKSPQVGNSDRDKPSSSFRTNGKALMGSSSKAYSSVNNFKKVSLESQGPSSHKGTLSADTNIHMAKVSSESSSSTEKFQIKVPAAIDAASGPVDGPLNTYEEVESNRPASSGRSQKQIHRWSKQAIQETSLGSSTRHSFGPRNTGHAAKNVSHGPGFSLSRSSSSMPHSNRYGLRNLGCTSIPDVLPPGWSSPNSNHNGRTEMARSSDRDCSLAKGKNIGTSSTAENLGPRKSSLSGRSLSLSERPAQPTSTRTKYWIPSRNGVASVRTRRTINEDSRSRVSEHGNNNTLRVESPIVIPQPLQSDLSLNQSSSSFSQQSLPELPAVGHNLCVQVGGRNDSVANSPIPRPQDVSARQSSGISIDRDGYRRYNRDGIAEVLLALERIEHDEELTYEQLLVLETNLFLSGLGFRDQHREMRLDVDNMSYEELLALGEKIGTVSTGLTEEQLSNCLKRSFFMPELLTVRIGGGGGGDDVKCSVCQEEYAERDEVGTLQCDHHYHLVCIHQWLRLKNWCPICKAPAADS